MPIPNPAIQTSDNLPARPCVHCMENGASTGICRKSKEGCSCATCIQGWSKQRWYQFKKIDQKPVAEVNLIGKCMVCYGRGIVEGATFKIRNYFPFFFALTVVLGCFLFFYLKSDSEKLTSSLMTILGTIVGFYFGGRSK